MCGLVGFTLPRPGEESILREMADAVTHRGPDDQGLHIDRGIALAHRRLSIIDLAGGNQPRTNEAGDALVFNGEIYGYRRLAATLEREGCVLADRSDTEVLFQMLVRLGVSKTLDAIDGMFAFVFREGATGRIHLVRDRMGEKPLFYLARPGRLYFASEIKALCRHPDVEGPRLDPASVGRYLTHEYVPGDETGFLEIRKVRPGYRILYDEGRLSDIEYWRPKGYGQGVFDSFEKATTALEEELKASVSDRLVADVPVGTFLSGGVDSSVITALVAEQTSRVTAFTVKILGMSFDESGYAEQLASRLGLRHEIIPLDREALIDATATVTAQMDELLADPSLIPTHLICREARKHAKVVLGGDGPDELLGGYVNFKAARGTPLLGAVSRPFARAVQKAIDLLPSSYGYMNAAFMVRQLLNGAGNPGHRQNALWMSPFAPWELDTLLDNTSADSAEKRLLWADRYAREVPEVDGIARLMHIMTRTYLAEDVLAKVDRASMLASLEVRSPYLAQRVAEMSFSLPTRWKVRGFGTKYILKKIAAKYIPPDIIKRRKHGFAIPMGQFMRHELREQVGDILHDSKSPVNSLINTTELHRYWNEHQAGQANHAKKLWAVFVLFNTARNLAATTG